MVARASVDATLLWVFTSVRALMILCARLFLCCSGPVYRKPMAATAEAAVMAKLEALGMEAHVWVDGLHPVSGVAGQGLTWSVGR